jgi:hypothetical protein
MSNCPMRRGRNTIEYDSVPLSLSMSDNDISSVSEGKPLDERILDLVAKNPSKVYATRLVTELGLSHEDASRELCGLLKAVGSGSSFQFEQLESDVVMCFSFPPDFRARARRSRALKSRDQFLWNTISIITKVLKLLTAFGLILSLLIVSVAGMIGLVAALIAMSRSTGNDHHRNQLMRRIRELVYSMRQILWCYAMFGHHLEGQDPFWSEIAYDLHLITSIFCGNPSSIWFWFRAQQLSHRRQYMERSWGELLNIQTERDASISSRNLRSSGVNEQDLPSDSSSLERNERHGLLSIVVEFLFGPVPFAPGPTRMEKWKLRAAVITELSEKHGFVDIKRLSPFVDDPPDSLDDSSKIQASGLSIVTYFNGIPKKSCDNHHEFIFPELLAEGTHSTNFNEEPNSDDGSWQMLLYAPDVVLLSVTNQIPSSFQEKRYRLTKLSYQQFLTCAVVGSLNFIGVWWLALSLQPGGILNDFIRNVVFIRALQSTIVPVLQFYSILFFILPTSRLIAILGFNSYRMTRNRKRAELAHALSLQSCL